MLVTARESSRILGGAGISRQQSRRVLLTGLAGAAVPTSSSLLYDEDRVRELGRWQVVDHEELLASCPGGVFVMRLGPGAEPDATAPWGSVAEALRVQPYLGFPAWLQVAALVSAYAPLPCVATVCGYPVLLADLVSFRSRADEEAGDQVVLGLEPAGEWAGLLARRRLVTSAGPPWLVLGAQPYLGRAARARARGEPVGAARSTTWTRWA